MTSPVTTGSDGPGDTPTRATLPRLLEAVLMVADEPLSTGDLAAGLGVPTAAVQSALEGLAQSYDQQERGFALRHVGTGWRYYSHPDCADAVGRFLLVGQSGRLSAAALETLAVIAYRQPVSRSRIAGIRGVNVDGVVRTLLARGLVEEASTDESTQAILYATTPSFLEKLGIRSLDELPPLAPLLPELADVDSDGA